MKNPSDLIYLPPRAATVTLDAAKRNKQYKSPLFWGIPEIDRRGNPPVPGDVVSLLGRPGMAKTATAIYLTHQWTEALRKAYPPDAVPVIVFFTLEVKVQDFLAAYVARDSGQSVADVATGVADIGKLQMALVKNLGNNLVVVGHADRDGFDQDMDGLFPSMKDLRYILAELTQQGYTIGAVVIDFLQYIGDDDNLPVSEKKGSEVTKNFMMCKALAMAFKTVVLVCVQANRRVDGYDGLKYPTMSDCEWSGAIEQVSNKVYSFTMPAKYMDLGDIVVCNGFKYEITDNLLAVRKLKEKYARCDKRDFYMLEINPMTSEFCTAPTVGEATDNEPGF